MRRIVAALAALPVVTATCAKIIRVGTFDESNPLSLLPMTRWLDDAETCFSFHRQPSGGRVIAHLESGDLDIAALGSTPMANAASAAARRTARRLLSLEISGPTESRRGPKARNAQVAERAPQGRGHDARQGRGAGSRHAKVDDGSHALGGQDDLDAVYVDGALHSPRGALGVLVRIGRRRL